MRSEATRSDCSSSQFWRFVLLDSGSKSLVTKSNTKWRTCSSLVSGQLSCGDLIHSALVLQRNVSGHVTPIPERTNKLMIHPFLRITFNCVTCVCFFHSVLTRSITLFTYPSWYSSHLMWCDWMIINHWKLACCLLLDVLSVFSRTS